MPTLCDSLDLYYHKKYTDIYLIEISYIILVLHCNYTILMYKYRIMINPKKIFLQRLIKIKYYEKRSVIFVINLCNLNKSIFQFKDSTILSNNFV